MKRDKLDFLKKEFHSKKKEIKNRLTEFSKVSQENYFYEMCYCILTPQTSAKKSMIAIENLQKLDFQNRNINPELILNNKNNYIRFHKNKSKYLVLLKENYFEVMKLFSKKNSNFELRSEIQKKIVGYGLKESSHFLRNVGYKNLAILDRHILKNLVKYKVIKSFPKSLNSIMYFKIEKKFLEFSKKIKISIDELDLFFWSFQTGEILK